jgi:hypothetical protein
MGKILTKLEKFLGKNSTQVCRLAYPWQHEID